MAPPRNRTAAPSGKGSGGGRGKPKSAAKVCHTPNRSATAKAPGAVDCHDGLTYAGSILAQRGRWTAYDASGHRIGVFDRERMASAAVYEASQPRGQP